MKNLEEVIQYCNDVVTHKIVAGRWTILACKRFLNDYKSCERDDYPFYFDEKSAEKIIRFAEATKQYEGQWKGQNLKLLPWQKWILMSIYGFKNKSDNTRRFRKAYIQVGRKQGKSTLISTLMIYELLIEPGCQALAACTKRDTARIIFNHIKEAINQNEALQKRLKVYNSTSRIVNENLAGYFEALPSDSNRMDGLNPSIVCIDEIGSHKSYDIVQRLQSGMGARKEGLIFEIGSATDDLYSAGAQELKRLKEILQGSLKDDSFFGVAYCIDDEDKWEDEKNYIKACPSLGYTVTAKFLHDLKVEALQQPSLQGEFITRNLGRYISSTKAWIQPNQWKKVVDNARKFTLDTSKPYYAVGAVDLSKRRDLSSLSICFYQEDHYFMKHWFFFPLDAMKEKIHEDNELWRYWTDKGYVIGTLGSTIDYTAIFEVIKQQMRDYNIECLLVDPYCANPLYSEFEANIDIIEVNQSMKYLSPFVKNLEEEIYKANLVDDNPVMTWMFSNAEIYTDANSNIKIVKPNGDKDSPKRIDGCITSAMTVGYIKQQLEDGEIDLRDDKQRSDDLEKMLSELDI